MRMKNTKRQLSPIELASPWGYTFQSPTPKPEEESKHEDSLLTLRIHSLPHIYRDQPPLPHLSTVSCAAITVALPPAVLVVLVPLAKPKFKRHHSSPSISMAPPAILQSPDHPH